MPNSYDAEQETGENAPADNAGRLTDEQVQQFIADGYLTVHADYPASFHEGICRKLDSVLEREGNPGNNILPRIPEIGQVFRHPAVAGALTSLLGPEYILNPHRHCHLNPPGSRGQSWHKDCYVFDHNLRHPRFSWVLAFYYPQETTAEMGPSGLLPGTQFQRTISDPEPAATREREAGICGPAGTVALIHFDSWHRALRNASGRGRYMLKFQFARLREPAGPTWNHRNPAWAPGSGNPNPRVSRDVWDWMRGSGANGAGSPAPGTSAEGDSESARLEAAYQLAAMGEAAVPELTAAMREQTLASLEETTAKTPDNAHGTNPTPGPAATALTAAGTAAVPAVIDTLGDPHWWVRTVAAGIFARMGGEAAEAVPALTAALGDDHWWVRRNAAEALGTIGQYGGWLVGEMRRLLGDGDYRVRRNAALTLAKIGPEAEAAVPDILPLLGDENRYNRFYGGLALRRIGTPKAGEALLDSLFESRWCPLTTRDDMY